MALAALVLAGAGITAGLSKLQGAAAKLAVSTTIGSALLFIQVPRIAAVLHLDPLRGDEWAIAAGGALAAALLAALAPPRRGA